MRAWPGAKIGECVRRASTKNAVVDVEAEGVASISKTLAFSVEKEKVRIGTNCTDVNNKIP